jgi:hypothetical protein
MKRWIITLTVLIVAAIGSSIIWFYFHQEQPPLQMEENWERDLKVAIETHPENAATFLEKDKTAIDSNTGEEWTRYYRIKGDIAWTCTVHKDPNGNFHSLMDQREDAKEFDPKYRKQITDAENYATACMKKEKMHGLGSCHAFWSMKKEYLRKHGINWRSPAELNPYTSFD